MPISHCVSASSAIGRGVQRRCPACGEAKAFKGYLRQVDACSRCGAELGAVRADDFPPYLTIFLVGHIVVPLLLIVERNYQWSAAVHILVWPTLTVLLSLLILPVVKGGVLGLMWSLGMTGREMQSNSE